MTEHGATCRLFRALAVPPAHWAGRQPVGGGRGVALGHRPGAELELKVRGDAVLCLQTPTLVVHAVAVDVDETGADLRERPHGAASATVPPDIASQAPVARKSPHPRARVLWRVSPQAPRSQTRWWQQPVRHRPPSHPQSCPRVSRRGAQHTGLRKPIGPKSRYHGRGLARGASRELQCWATYMHCSVTTGGQRAKKPRDELLCRFQTIHKNCKRWRRAQVL